MGVSSLVCVNHPRRTTRVSCSACGSPICTDCMRETPVGMKCPACARQPRHARGLAKPRHYVVATAGGLASATVLGIFATWAHLGYVGIIVPIIAGVVVGVAVSRGAKGLRHNTFRWIAAATAVVGLVAGSVIAGDSPAQAAGPGALFGLLLAGLAAAYVAGL